MARFRSGADVSGKARRQRWKVEVRRSKFKDTWE